MPSHPSSSHPPPSPSASSRGAMRKIFAAALCAATAFSPLPARAHGLPDFVALAKSEGPPIVSVRTKNEPRPRPDSRRNAPDGPLPFPFPFPHPPGPDRGGPGESQGSGFIIDRAGHILTNDHVVRGADEVYVALKDGREFEVEVIGSDRRSDIALLRIDPDDLADGEPLPEPVKIGDSDGLEVGQWVVAIGAPFGLRHTVTQGIISAIGRHLPRDIYVPFIQTSAAVNPGNSGGPLMSLDGKVVGINAQILSPNRTNAGIAFAIPINVAMDIQRSLRRDGIVKRGRLGVYFGPVTPELADAYGLAAPRGAIVSEVVPESSAEDAGIESADIILSLNGEEIGESGELPILIGASGPGTTVTLTILRDGEELEMTAVLDSLDDAEAAEAGLLGLHLENLDDEAKEAMGLAGGVRVVAVEPGQKTPTDVRNKIRRGDVILGILVKRKMRLTPNREALTRALTDADEDDTIVLTVIREGRRQIVTVRLGR